MTRISLLYGELKEKYMNIFSTMISLLLFFSFLHAQNPEWITYTSENYISSLVIEGKYVWAGTSAGLLRIDKITHEETLYNHTNSGLPNNNIYTVAIDGLGNKWIGTAGGMAMFDGTNWTVYDSSNSNLPYAQVFVLIIDSMGTKWIGTNGSGLVKYDGIHWTVYTSSNSDFPKNALNVVLSLTIDYSGIIWIGTEGDIAKFDGINWKGYSRLSRDGETALLAGDSGTMWIGTGGNGLAKFDGKNWTVYTALNSGLSENHVKTLAKDRLGNIWIGTWGGGLVKFDGIHWTVFTTSNSGLPNNYIDALAIDSSGNKWVGTYGGGLVVFNQGGVVSVKENKNNKQLPDEYFLSQNYPNPFNPSTTIHYGLAARSTVRLVIYNILGQLVSELVNTEQQAGYQSIVWNANVSSGLYFYKLEAVSARDPNKRFIETKKILLLR